MGTKVWNFLLPSAGGRHQLRVEHLGKPDQAVYIDGELQTASKALIFTGPGNSLLELRKGQGGHWSLLVNGLIVEDYCEGKRNSKDESLRELRGKAEGSYVISTDFDAANLRNTNVIRIFRFTAFGHAHEVQVSHHECIWQVLFDGKLIERVVHTLGDNSGKATFKLEVADGERVDGELHMTWLGGIQMIWRYTLTVNNVEIPVCWTKVKGDIEPPPPPPEVLGSAKAESLSPEPAPVIDQVEEQEPSPASSTPLPQGVSYDAVGGAYQATIRSKAGKFVFLGEFRTPEEAHACYLEALPMHRPDKALAPEPPS